MAAQFTVDLEFADHAILPPGQWGLHDVEGLAVTSQLLEQLKRAKIRAHFYVLGYFAQRWPMLIRHIVADGHQLGSHGYWHGKEEQEMDLYDLDTRQFLPHCQGYRSPYWKTTPRPGWSGGVFFRTLPYRWLKWEIERSGVFWIHPHDLYNAHIGPWRRRLFFCDPWQRLDRLMREVDWDAPR